MGLISQNSMQKAENIVVVGTGDLYHRFLAPSLAYMQGKGILNVICTLDIRSKQKEDTFLGDKGHRLRSGEQKLSVLLSDLKNQDPIVYLGHANNFHISDAEDLLSTGFRVILEKPYCINKIELETLKQLCQKYSEKIVLVDYYLMRKAIPLLILSGLVKKDSFYLKTDEVIRTQENSKDILELSGQIKDILGDPSSISIKIMEGTTDSGKIDHRGSYLFDSARGGGMIQDLGLHGIIALFALKSYLGETTPNSDLVIKTAKSKEYFEMATEQHKIPKDTVAETYSKLCFITKSNIPSEILAGKYVSDISYQKKILVNGSKGSLSLDLYDNILYFIKKDSKIKKLELINANHTRYYPVILTALETLNGRSPFNINTNELLINAQEFTLQVLDKAQSSKEQTLYKTGENYYEIFKDNKLKITVPNITFSTNKILSDRLSGEFPNAIIKYNTLKERFAGEALVNFLRDADIALVGLEDINESLLKHCKNLKLVAKYGVGIDNIDFEACKKYNVQVGFKKGVNKRSVAELTLAFMLGLIRNSYVTSNQLKKGQWNKSGGVELTGKTIGIIGVGNVGKELISLLKPFNCKILVNDIVDQKEYYFANGLIESSKEEIYAQADIISLHVPLTKTTEKMINKNVISLMKPSSFLINTARGQIIDEQDLLVALKNNNLAGAALDVYYEEPPKNRELVELPNVICTPHIAGNSKEAVIAMGDAAISSIKEFIQNASEK